MSSRLERLSRRVDDDPFFLASVLASYMRAERLDEAGLARVLGCAAETLIPLRLCRRPHPDARFRGDVEKIASRFHIDAVALAQVVRRVDALASLRPNPTEAVAAPTGWLVAARDAVEPGLDPEPGDPGPQ